MKGSCKCGKVKIEASESPFAAFRCHCSTCYAFRKSSGASVKELDQKHPVAGVYRGGVVKVTQGSEHIEYTETRGSLPFLTGVSRGFCTSCKTPGVIEHFRDPWYRLLFGGANFVYTGYVFKDEPESTCHICYDTATEGAKALAEKDGKPKYGGITGPFMGVVWGAFANRKVLTLIMVLLALRSLPHL